MNTYVCRARECILIFFLVYKTIKRYAPAFWIWSCALRFGERSLKCPYRAEVDKYYDRVSLVQKKKKMNILIRDISTDAVIQIVFFFCGIVLIPKRLLLGLVVVSRTWRLCDIVDLWMRFKNLDGVNRTCAYGGTTQWQKVYGTGSLRCQCPGA